jgi:hypothetical protein
MMLRQWLSTASLLALVAGCSPYSFSKETAAMSDGVNKISDAFSTGYSSLAADRANRVQTTILDSRERVRVAPICQVSDAKHDGTELCALYVGKDEPRLAPAEQTHPDTSKAIKRLKDYANALAAVTNAADRTAYDAAVAQLSGAVGTITTKLDAVEPGISTLAPAAVNVVGWLFGTALDQQRYASLKRAITTVGLPVADDHNKDPDSPIRVVTRAFGKGLLMLKISRLGVLQNELAALVRGLNERGLGNDAYRSRLTDSQTTLATIVALRQSDPTGAASDLADAHDALVLAVSDPTKNYTALVKALGDFTDKVSALHTALTKMSKTSTSKTGS